MAEREVRGILEELVTAPALSVKPERLPRQPNLPERP